jgi:hypothetical protein
MAFEGYGVSAPRIVIQMKESKTYCTIPEDTVKRFGRVYQNGKQGMHLFSAGYYLSSLAVHFNGKALQDAAEEIITHFHINFLTKLLINAQFKPIRATVFNTNWIALYDQLIEAYQEFVEFLEFCKKKCKTICDIDHPETLENYLNLVGALQYIFPCNVVYAENSTDPFGGGRSSAAIGRLDKYYNNLNNYNDSSLRDNIKNIVDAKVIEEVFRNGFDENNNWCLAFIIMQTQELRELRSFYCHHANCRIMKYSYSEMGTFVWDVANSFNQKQTEDSYKDAFNKAIKKIEGERSFVVLNVGSPSSISDKIKRML